MPRKNSWNIEDLNFLRFNFHIYSNQQLSIVLNKNIKNISSKAIFFNLKKNTELLSIRTSASRTKVSFPKSELEKMYFQEGLSIKDISKRLFIDRTSLWRYMKKKNIILRSRIDAQKLKLKKLNSIKDLEGKSINNSFYGKHHKKESVDKKFLTNLKRGNFVKSSERMKNKNPSFELEVRKKISLANMGKSYSVQTQFKKGDPKLIRMRSKLIIPMKDTSIEVKIQNFLKESKIDFFTHQYIKDIQNSYQCDIFIPSINLIIECDGDYWHGNPLKYKIEDLTERQRKQKMNDELRTQQLKEKGYKVLRLWENEIRFLSLQEFQKKIFKKINKS